MRDRPLVCSAPRPLSGPRENSGMLTATDREAAAVDTDTAVFEDLLSDAEDALAGGPDDREWARDVPVPQLRAIVQEAPALLEAHPDLRDRYESVGRKVRAL